MAAFGGTIYSKQSRKAKKSNNSTYSRPTYDDYFYKPTVNVPFVPEYFADAHTLIKLKLNGKTYLFYCGGGYHDDVVRDPGVREHNGNVYYLNERTIGTIYSHMKIAKYNNILNSLGIRVENPPLVPGGRSKQNNTKRRRMRKNKRKTATR
jgi:hypothetical protein